MSLWSLSNVFGFCPKSCQSEIQSLMTAGLKVHRLAVWIVVYNRTKMLWILPRWFMANFLIGHRFLTSNTHHFIPWHFLNTWKMFGWNTENQKYYLKYISLSLVTTEQLLKLIRSRYYWKYNNVWIFPSLEQWSWFMHLPRLLYTVKGLSLQRGNSAKGLQLCPTTRQPMSLTTGWICSGNSK